MAQFNDINTSVGSKVDTNGTSQTGLYDANGNPIFKTLNNAYITTDRIIPLGSFSDNSWKGLRTDKIGGYTSSSSFIPLITYTIETTTVPKNWNNPLVTMTTSTTLAAGSLLNASNIGTASTYAATQSFKAVPKDQRIPLILRLRARLVKGGANSLADWGFTNAVIASSVTLVAGFYFLYGDDGTLKPTASLLSNHILQGVDIAPLIDSTCYYNWEIVLDDNYVRFIVSDPNLQTIISDQTILIPPMSPRFGQYTHWYPFARCYADAAASAAGVQFTQLYVGDGVVGVVDVNYSKPYPHIQAGNFLNSQSNPTTASQISNWTNSTVPATATPTNASASYTTLGGEFLWTTLGATDTDYDIFAFQATSPYTFYCTGISIDTVVNVVGTAGGTLQWGAAFNSPAATLATNTYRLSLGAQSWQGAVPVGTQFQQIIKKFDTPYVIDASRYIQIFVKLIGTVVGCRGIVGIEGYFE